MSVFRKVSGFMVVYLPMGALLALLPHFLFVRSGRRGAVASFAVLFAGLVWGDVSTNTAKYHISLRERIMLTFGSAVAYSVLVGLKGWSKIVAYPLLLFIGWFTPFLYWNRAYKQGSPVMRHAIARRLGLAEEIEQT